MLLVSLLKCKLETERPPYALPVASGLQRFNVQIDVFNVVPTVRPG
jgi:hypothetical protein